MPGLEGLPAEWQGPATAFFIVAVSLFAAWARVFGKKEGPAQRKVQEFAVAGQLADMGPVKQLIETVGLLVQQQIRTNLHLEATATAERELVDLLASHLADLRAERAEREADEAIEERAQQIAEKLIKAMKPARKRVVQRREPTPKP